MKISCLKIKNFLSISDVEITPGKCTQIVGANSQGKTSILKALEFATKGSSDGSLVKSGENEAEVIIELDDETIIRRRIKADGKQNVSIKKGDFEAKSPQSILDGLFHGQAFNPLDLLDPSKRNDAIMSAIDLKVSSDDLATKLGVKPEELPPLEFNQHGLRVLEQAHKFYYQRRAEANKDAETKKKRWETYLADVPKSEVAPSITREEVATKQANARFKIKSIEQKLMALDVEVKRVKTIQEKLERYNTEIQAIDNDIKLAMDVISKQETYISKLKDRKTTGEKYLKETINELPESIESKDPLLSEIQIANDEMKNLDIAIEQIKKFEALDKNKAMVDSMKTEYETAKAFADTLSNRVAALAGPIKKDILASVEMPIKDLSYQDGKFTVGGFPVDNLSTSVSMKLALSVARRLSNKTKVICLDGAESLDSESYKVLRDEIENDGFSYFITAVGKGFDEPRDKIITMQHGSSIQ